MKIFLKNEYVRRQIREFDDLVFLTYVGLRTIQEKENNICVVFLEKILCNLYGEQKVSRWIRKGICDSIGVLEDIDKIEVLHEIGKQHNKWKLDLSNVFLNPETETYTIVDHNEVIKILSLPYTDKKKVNLLRYYCVLVSTMNKEIGNLSLSRIRDFIDISKTTQIQYNKILEDNQLIYFKRMDMYLEDSLGHIKSLTNYYGLYKKKEQIEDKALKALRKNKKNGAIKARHNANKMRSIKQKLKKGSLLTWEEIEVIICENRHCDIMAAKSKDIKRKDKYLEKKIIIDYYNDSVVNEKERKIIYKNLAKQIRELGERIIYSNHRDLLEEAIEKTLGKGHKASDLTIMEIVKMVTLNDELIKINDTLDGLMN